MVIRPDNAFLGIVGAVFIFRLKGNGKMINLTIEEAKNMHKAVNIEICR